jgi:hypothetical protein
MTRPRRSRRGSIMSDLLRTAGQALNRIPNSETPATGVGAVNGPAIQAGSIDASHLQPNSVGSAVIIPGSVDITKFASGIEPVQIVTGLPALPNTAYPVGTVAYNTTDGKIYRNVANVWTASITSADIPDGAITTAKLSDLAVTLAKLAALSVDTTKLVDNAVTGVKVATGAITTTKITDDAITTPKIATGAVTADEIAALSIIAGKIAAGAVSTTELAAAAVTAAKIAANTITSNEIAALTIQAVNIAAGAITTAKIAALAVTAGELAADSVIAGKIAAAAVNAREIAAGAIQTEKLTVGLLQDSILLNASFEEAKTAEPNIPQGWTWGWSDAGTPGAAGVDITTAQLRSGAKSVALKAPPAGFAVLRTDDPFFIPVSAGDSYYGSVWAKSDVAQNGGGFLEIAFYNEAKVYQSSLYSAANYNTTTTWTKYEGSVGIPAGCAFAALFLYNFHPSVQSTIYIDDVTFQKIIGSAMIADLAVTNAKIQNLTVTNIKIADLTLTAGKYLQVRNVIQIPFDDSIDSTHPLECFFQMPTGVVAVKSTKVWVQQKSFRQYSSGASSTSGGGSTTSTSTTHGHNVNNDGTQYSTGSDSTATGGSTDAQLNHDHTYSGGNTGVNGAHSHLVNSHWHTHSHSVFFGNVTGLGGSHNHSVDTTHNHTITMTPGIFETAATGTLSLKVADDGSTYGAAVVSGVTSITAQAITLTTTAGDRRIKLETTGLNRVQVLVVMDLILELGAP